jgi:glutamate dehydrogenase/leucine dehydrogenase
MSVIASLSEIPLDEIGPERIIHVYEPKSGLRAVVVIDTTRFGLTAGGVRMAADLSLSEMARLARAMTYKFAMLELPCGGAKAGIWLHPAAPSRPTVMQAFLDAIAPLVESRQYMAGADMGTSAADFAPLYAASGRQSSLGDQISTACRSRIS